MFLYNPFPRTSCFWRPRESRVFPETHLWNGAKRPSGLAAWDSLSYKGDRNSHHVLGESSVRCGVSYDMAGRLVAEQSHRRNESGSHSHTQKYTTKASQRVSFIPVSQKKTTGDYLERPTRQTEFVPGEGRLPKRLITGCFLTHLDCLSKSHQTVYLMSEAMTLKSWTWVAWSQVARGAPMNHEIEKSAIHAVLSSTLAN